MTNLLRAATEKKSRKAKKNANQVVAYIRVSTDEQKLSPDAQKAELEKFAAANGLVIVEAFYDLGVSGAADLADCHGLTSALAHVQEQKLGGILALRLDRIARDTQKSALVEIILSRSGASLILVDGNNAADPMANITRMLQSWMAEQERRLIGERTKSALRQLAAQKKHHSRHAPLGYKVQDGNLVPEPKEQECLKLILQLNSQGVGPTFIARQLTAKGFTSRTGKAFNAPTVRAVIQRHQEDRAML